MTTNFHTAISTGAAANAATVNSPLSQLDTQITADNAEIVAARGSLSTLDGRLDVSLNNDGTIKNGAVSAQAMINLGTAAAAAGDAVRYDEFTVEHNADGTHKSNIIDQAEINLTAAAAASGEATRFEEFTQEHNANGSHKDNIIDQAEINLSSAADANGEAIRYEEFIIEHEADGNHAATGWLVNSMVNAAAALDGTKVNAATTSVRGTVELATNGEDASNVVVQGNDDRLNRRDVVYIEHTNGGGNGVEAATFTQYAMVDPQAIDEEVKVRFALYISAAERANTLMLSCNAYRSGSGQNAYVKLAVASITNQTEVTKTGSMGNITVTLDISALAVGHYECTISLRWASEPPGSGGTVYMEAPYLVLYQS